MGYHFLWMVMIVVLVVGAQACSKDEDCFLNGVCTNGACVCDYGWSGTACTSIKFKPTEPTGAYGYTPNVTAWGGNPVLIGDIYHLLVAEMVNGCGLCNWGSNSEVVHATSKNLLGPYTFQNVALPVWAHNPQVVVDNSTGTSVYLLFHIGSADGGNPKVCNRTEEERDKIDFDASSQTLHTSTNIAGPYTPQETTGLGGCNNPAPYVFPNGSILLVCSQGGTNVFTAETWKGPWTGRSLTYSGDAGLGIWEDPFIWRDKRGVFKMIAHVYPSPSNKSIPFWERVSGFAYSYDGFDWVRQPWQPYTNKVLLTNGTYQAFETRERPKIFFDPSDRTTPLALFNGMAPHGFGTGCWDCKTVCGIDWTYNLGLGIEP